MARARLAIIAAVIALSSFGCAEERPAISKHGSQHEEPATDQQSAADQQPAVDETAVPAPEQPNQDVNDEFPFGQSELFDQN